MKRTLAAQLAAYPGARLLTKFGAVHADKSINPLDQRDLGAYVAEVAEGEGVSALHIMVLAAKGLEASYAGVGRPAAVRSFDMKNEAPDWRSDVAPGQAVGAGLESWMLVDLRKLRGDGLASAPPAWRELVMEYDMAILAPTFTACRGNPGR